jgi:hypothetical protein
MSSVTATDRNRADETIRRNREEYQNRENQLIKRHKQEVKHLTEENQKEIEELKGDYSEQLDEMREKMRETLTNKDQQNLKKIDDMRQAYLDSLRNKIADNDEKRNELKESYAAERAKDKEINEQQKHILKNNFDAELQVREKAFQDYSKQAQGEVKETIENRTKKLNEKHGSELQAMREDRDHSVAQVQKTLSDTETAYRIKLQDTQRMKEQETGRLRDNFENIVQNEQKERQNLLSTLNDVQKNERQQMRRTFN